MKQGSELQLPVLLRRVQQLLEFHPWMLALAVFLACALGIAVMEQFRDAGARWAQVTAQDAPAR